MAQLEHVIPVLENVVKGRQINADQAAVLQATLIKHRQEH